MKRLQAAMRDAAASRARSMRGMYRVGSIFKACANCESTDVYRAWQPKWTGWTWWCYECGSKDLDAWAPDEFGFVESQLGKEPVRKPRSEQAAVRRNFINEVRDNLRQMDGDAGGDSPRSLRRTNVEDDLHVQINELRRQLNQWMKKS